MFGISLPNPLDGLKKVGSALSDGFHAATSWVGDNWKTIVAMGVSTLVFAAVIALCVACPFAIPALIAVAAAGFASGVTFYALNNWLNGKPGTWQQALIQGGISAVISVATLGVGRYVAPYVGDMLAPVAGRVLPEAAETLVPGAVKTALTNSTAGAAFGAATQVAQNALTGRPLGEGVGDATALGAINGLVSGPANRFMETIQHPTQGPVENAWPVAKDSPTFQQDYAQFLANGGRVRWGEYGKGTYYSPSDNTIVIDPYNRVAGVAARGGSRGTIATSLAHELGHGNDFESPRRLDPYAFGSRDDYVNASVDGDMNSEGIAVLNEALVRQEVLAAGGPDIGGSPSAGRYKQIAEDPTLTRQQKIDAFAELYANEVPSTQPLWRIITGRGLKYRQSYGEFYAQWWDQHIPSDENGIPLNFAPRSAAPASSDPALAATTGGSPATSGDPSATGTPPSQTKGLDGKLGDIDK